MSEPSQIAIGALDWVLILAPFRRDAAFLSSLLTENQLSTRAADPTDLADRLSESPGVLVVTHEALDPNIIDILGRFVREQANWSEVSIIILLDRAARQSIIQSTLSTAWPRARLIYYQRPVVALELISGIQSALLTRFRQREVRDSLQRETELRLELTHRVKNILASVISIFKMTRRAATSLDALTEDFEGRLLALAKVHSIIFTSGGEEVALADIVASTIAPYRSDQQTAIYVNGPDVLIAREAGTTLALCLHELATNAIKYGALSRPEGTVSLEWELSSGEDPELTLRWTEIGGPSVVAPSRVGYGTRYMRSALASLFGEPPDLIFAADGLRCTIHGPLSRISRTYNE